MFQEFMIGDLLIVLALVFFAYTYMPVSRIRKKVNSRTLIFMLNLISLLFFVPISLLFFYPNVLLGIDNIGIVIAYAFSFYVFGLLLWSKSLKDTKPWIVASILALSPVFGALLAFFLLGQTLTTIQLLGGIIIIAASFLVGKENIKD